MVGSGWESFEGMGILVVGYRSEVGALLRRGLRVQVPPHNYPCG